MWCSGGKHKIKVACPKNRRVVGGGYGRFPTDTIASEPYDSKDQGKAPDDGWKMTVRYAGGTPEAMYAWASCLKSRRSPDAVGCVRSSPQSRVRRP